MSTQVSPQHLLHFACQTLFNGTGTGGCFENDESAYHKHAIEVCGFQGVTLPVHPKTFDLVKAVESNSYTADLQARLLGYGYTRPLGRLESHTISQNVCLSYARILRFGYFLTEDFKSADVATIEKIAKAQMLQLIDVAARDGIKHLIIFLGGKGYPVGQSKWSAYPAFFQLWVMAVLAHAWNDILEYAADHGVVLYHEAFHPESDILSGQNFVMFYNMLSPKARKGFGANLDISHLQNVGVDPIPHVKAVLATGCPIQVHYKGGVVFERGDGTTTPLGAYDGWSTASSTFVTVGTIGDEAVIREFHHLVAARHLVQGDIDIVYEGECVILGTKQGMQIGGYNCRALMDGKDLHRIIGFAPESRASTVRHMMHDGLSAPKIMLAGAGGYLDVQADAIPFDKCFTPPVMPWELMELTEEETSGARKVLGRAGFEEASKLGMAA